MEECREEYMVEVWSKELHGFVKEYRPPVIKRRRFTKNEREVVYNKFDGHCAYCGREIPIERMVVDHKNAYECEKHNPKVHDIENLMPACRSCNQYKHTLDIEGLRMAIGNMYKNILSAKPYLAMLEEYGIVIHNKIPVVFYFEKMLKGEN